MITVKRFYRDQRGVVALMFGLMILPLMGAIGLAIDFGNVMVVRTKAQMAADAAALQASGIARDLIKSRDASDVNTAEAIKDAKQRATNLFLAHAEQSKIKDYELDVDVKREGQTLVATVTFSVETTNHVGRIFGRDTFEAVGSATSTSSLPIYSDVHLALDVSASMGIAASRADMIKLFNSYALKTDGASAKTKCVFACHVPEPGWAVSNSAVAKANGVKLRIDVLRDAVKAMIAEAQKDAESRPIYRLALYGLGGSLDASTWTLDQIAALSDNFTLLGAAASSIDIQTSVTKASYQRSYLNEQINKLSIDIPASKDGSSQANSKKYVFLITDGARDVPPAFGSCTVPPKSGRCVNGINPTYCKALKDKGITVGVLYTTYIPVTEDPAEPNGKLEKWYELEMVQTKTDVKLGPALQQCASPGWFFEASDETGIRAAMKAMFEQTTQAPQLTN